MKIETEEDHNKALRRIEILWGSKPNTPEGEELDALVSLVCAYEEDVELAKIVEERKAQREIDINISDL